MSIEHGPSFEKTWSSKEISQKDWGKIEEKLNEELKEAKKGAGWGSFLKIAANAKIVNPELDIQLDENSRKAIRDYQEKKWKGWEIAVTSSAIKIVSPEDVHLTDENWKRINKDLGQFIYNGEWADVGMLLSHTRILDPDEKHRVNLTPTDLERIWDGLMSKYDRLKREDFWGFADFARKIQIIAPIFEKPEPLHGGAPEIDVATWNKMREELEDRKEHNDWSGYTHMVANMKILASSKLKLSSTETLELG